ncbi:hypothetical protein TRFO_22184 [Tritrichomonas foetus]|uniref:Protein kinase domain-containing protein n=1 Tax=Tritrichomonas foetus TaxID=1144522 RepID=A0A1J4KDH5_9EUKA|nr:hypothetical protein TRFO_22184 [Tritrichomonas foetus]|eukprot:OHT09034.1 hypothetical protein TRFO_22184 [Tritrichomonas foetus]
MAQVESTLVPFFQGPSLTVKKLQEAQHHLWEFCRAYFGNGVDYESSRKLFESMLSKIYLNKFNRYLGGSGKLSSSRFFSDFTEIELISSKSNSSVYLVKSIVDHNYYAIKRTTFSLLNENQIMETIDNIKRIATIRHGSIARYFTCWFEFDFNSPNILKSNVNDLADDYSDGEDDYMKADIIFNEQIELLDSTPFTEFICFYKNPIDALNIAKDISNALKALHCAGIAHGNLKPTKILSDFEGNVKLIGIQGLRSSHDMMSDVYNFGKILSEIPIFSCAAEIIEKMMCEIPEKRPTISDVSDQFNELIRSLNAQP